ITITHPDWVPETATNSATFYGLVTFDGTNATEEDWVAAYIDGVNRGVSPIKIIQNEPYVIFNIQADMEGEATFKLYDASTDQICAVEETTLIMPGFDIGTPAEPIILNGNCANVDTPPTCNLIVDNQVICAGKNIMVQFDCTLPDDYTYEWNFDSATVIAGQDLGPYELNWETAGTKTVRLLTYQNGNLISTVSQKIEVLTVDLKEVIVSICTGESYEFGDTLFTEPTFYIGEYTNQNGCDSLVLLNLMVSDTACQPMATLSLAGTISTEDLSPVNEVAVAIMEMDTMTKSSNVEGDYLIDNIPYHIDSTYTLKPTKTTNPLAGVTTYDLVLMSKFILGLHKFDSPYQYIAADINKSGTITAVDIVELRQLMLNATNQFSNNDAWRFVAANFDFPPMETTNPLTIDFPETITPNALPMDSMGHNFIAVKIGDINGSHQANSRVSNTATNSFRISMLEQEIVENTTTMIQLIGNMEELAGFQFTLKFDPTLLSVVDIKEQLLTKENIGIHQLSEGLLHFSWLGKAKTDQLITLMVKGKTTTSTSKAFQLYTKALRPEAYNNALQTATLELNFEEIAAKEAIRLYQNEPNPFNQETIIRFALSNTTYYQLTISDINGKLLKQIRNQGSIGLNEVKINSSLLGNPGIYYYRLISDGQSSTKKMILIE
ncbi:MAG: T9SS type A sorting domain-containing protein, partial [Saprospiraceae bacterium]